MIRNTRWPRQLNVWARCFGGPSDKRAGPCYLRYRLQEPGAPIKQPKEFAEADPFKSRLAKAHLNLCYVDDEGKLDPCIKSLLIKHYASSRRPLISFRYAYFWTNWVAHDQAASECESGYSSGAKSAQAHYAIAVFFGKKRTPEEANRRHIDRLLH